MAEDPDPLRRPCSAAPARPRSARRAARPRALPPGPDWERLAESGRHPAPSAEHLDHGPVPAASPPHTREAITSRTSPTAPLEGITAFPSGTHHRTGTPPGTPNAPPRCSRSPGAPTAAPSEPAGPDVHGGDASACRSKRARGRPEQTVSRATGRRPGTRLTASSRGPTPIRWGPSGDTTYGPWWRCSRHPACTMVLPLLWFPLTPWEGRISDLQLAPPRPPACECRGTSNSRPRLAPREGRGCDT